MSGRPGGEEGLDDYFASHADDNVGATIMGRHMFGPDRGAWDLNRKGWWGENPPYHHPVFVLCHRKREGIESALRQAAAAAKGRDVRLGG